MNIQYFTLFYLFGKKQQENWPMSNLSICIHRKCISVTKIIQDGCHNITLYYFTRFSSLTKYWKCILFNYNWQISSIYFIYFFFCIKDEFMVFHTRFKKKNLKWLLKNNHFWQIWLYFSTHRRHVDKELKGNVFFLYVKLCIIYLETFVQEFWSQTLWK